MSSVATWPDPTVEEALSNPRVRGERRFVLGGMLWLVEQQRDNSTLERGGEGVNVVT